MLPLTPLCSLIEIHAQIHVSSDNVLCLVTANRTVGKVHVGSILQTSRTSPLSKGSPASRDGMSRSFSGLYMKCAFM